MTNKQIIAKLNKMGPDGYEMFAKNLILMLSHLPYISVDFKPYRIIIEAYRNRAIEGALEQTKLDCAAIAKMNAA